MAGAQKDIGRNCGVIGRLRPLVALANSSDSGKPLAASVPFRPGFTVNRGKGLDARSRLSVHADAGGSHGWPAAANSKMQLKEALGRFLVQLRADGRSPHTVGQYERHVRAFADWARSVCVTALVGEIDHEHLAAFLASPAATSRPDGSPKRAGSMNALRSSLRGFFDYLERTAAVSQSPAKVLRMARVGQQRPKVLSGPETERLTATLDAATAPAGKRDRALFRFLLGTGTRISSALSLDVGDLDLDRGEAHLRSVKGGGSHSVFLDVGLCALLRDHLGARRSGPVFRSDRGQAISQRHVQRRFASCIEAAQVPARYCVHSLRHTFATRLYERTGDLLVVKEALGHRSITSTLIYAQADAGRVRAAIAGSA